MNQNFFKNISNHESPLNFKTISGSKDIVTQLVIKRNPRESSTKLINKKSVKKMLPKYLIYANSEVQKQKLLQDIESEHTKLKKQHFLKKTLINKLEKKQNSNQNRLILYKKAKQLPQQKTKNISRTLTASTQNLLLSKNISHQNQLKSISSQLQTLTLQLKKNQEKIHKMKQSRKYTRFIENQEEKNTYLSELKNMKKYTKKINFEMNRLKRVHLQKKRLRIKQILMEDEIENTIEAQNINIYHHIEEVKQKLLQAGARKANLHRKKQTLLQQIQMLKQNYDIPVEVIENYYKTVEASKRWTVKTSTSNLKISAQLRPLISNLKGLKSLKQEDYSQQESSINSQKAINGCKKQSRKDFIKQTAVETVKIHSDFQSDNQEFLYVGYDDSENEITRKAREERQKIAKLQKKYFYEDDDFEEEQKSQNVDKFYDLDQYQQDQSFEQQEDNSA